MGFDRKSPILDYNSFVNKIFKKSISDSSICHTFVHCYGNEHGKEMNQLVNGLIETYNYGCSSLWNIKFSLVSKNLVKLDDENEIDFYRNLSGRGNIRLFVQYLRRLQT